jgi:hypothetical protein
MSVDHVLERLVPISEAEGDWERVLADAEREPTRYVRALGLGVPVIAAAIVALVALAWPFESEPPTVLDRALAAIGDGPVIHIVTRSDWGGSLVDLSTGEVTPRFTQSEVWSDPDRGVHRVTRFGDRVTSDFLMPPGAVSAREVEQYKALLDRYRADLRSGKARVVGRGSVNGRAVLWIRLRGQWLPDVDDGHYHLFAQEVAVDRDTFEPVYSRFTRDGRQGPVGSGLLFLKLETLPAGQGDFDVDPSVPSRHGTYAGAELGRDLRRNDLARLFGRPAIWLGPSHEDKPLAESRELLFKHKEKRDDPWQVVRGATLFYGELRPERAGIRLREENKPYVLLTQAAAIAPMWRGAELAANVPEGSIQVDATRVGFLRMGGLYVSINAKRLRDVLSAATALRPYGSEAPAPSTLDVERVALEVARRTTQIVEAKGGAIVRARPFANRGTKAVQTGSGGGVTVRIYRSGAAVFDTRRMSADRRAMIHSDISAGCVKVAGPRGSIGGFSTPFRPRISILVLGHFRRGERPRPMSPPFDACELGLGQGRNQLPRFGFHGPVEIPLTERGRRFFEERAAAREITTFARVGAMRRAREAMRRGTPAPAAATLADPRGRVAVVSSGYRITVSLRATTGRRFFVEIVRGRVVRTNAGGFARVR